MKLLRNPELKKSIIFQLILCAVAAAVCAFFSIYCTVIVIALSAFLVLLQLLFYKKRYDKITELYEDINKVLSGNDEISFSSCEEGELSILKSEINKMTLKLREQARGLLNDKIILKDSLVDISHQLNTPLTSMNLILSLMRKEDMTHAQKMTHIRNLSELLSHTQRLLDILLKISRFDAGAVNLRNEQISGRKLIEAAISPLEIMAEVRGIRIKCDCDDDVFDGDMSWCCEAVSNIIKNCIEHTYDTVEISAKKNALSYIITISDNGEGISEKDMPHIFDRFYRRDDGENIQSGYGIGLALARKIVTAQDGIIKAANRKNGGARFTVCFYKKGTAKNVDIPLSL